jgi:hypothetical protein
MTMMMRMDHGVVSAFKAWTHSYMQWTRLVDQTYTDRVETTDTNTTPSLSSYHPPSMVIYFLLAFRIWDLGFGTWDSGSSLPPHVFRGTARRCYFIPFHFLSFRFLFFSTAHALHCMEERTGTAQKGWEGNELMALWRTGWLSGRGHGHDHGFSLSFRPSFPYRRWQYHGRWGKWMVGVGREGQKEGKRDLDSVDRSVG